ncbi:MAG TPA: OmpA family protein [Bacteroidia bacterium]|jgi:OOP family OmpA-OmpF porin|nr:OmpA family protein [Bacteroidia bacterium]
MKKHILLLMAFALATVYGFSQTVLQPDTINALLNVAVVDFQNHPLAGEKVAFTSVKTSKTYGGVTDANGKFQLLLPKACDYKISYKQFTSSTDYNKSLTIPSSEGYLTFNYTIRVELPKTYTLKAVFFDTGKATLRKESNKELDDLTDFMKHQKTMQIEIAGYTDNVGNDADNLKLSQDRADAVRNYLISHGISADKVVAKGYGSSNPVASNDTPDGKQQNRRTEVHILKS